MFRSRLRAAHRSFSPAAARTGNGTGTHPEGGCRATTGNRRVTGFRVDAQGISLRLSVLTARFRPGADHARITTTAAPTAHTFAPARLNHLLSLPGRSAKRKAARPRQRRGSLRPSGSRSALPKVDKCFHPGNSMPPKTGGLRPESPVSGPVRTTLTLEPLPTGKQSRCVLPRGESSPSLHLFAAIILVAFHESPKSRHKQGFVHVPSPSRRKVARIRPASVWR